MAHYYDRDYDTEEEKESDLRRLNLKNNLRNEIAKLRQLVGEMQHSVYVPQRFKDALEDFNNYLK